MSILTVKGIHENLSIARSGHRVIGLIHIHPELFRWPDEPMIRVSVVGFLTASG